ncbi:MAG: DUF2442 domain-containing protein [Deltaproteobacteria bacterium]|nr:DUF2442 domain-containing protein [Deltaproteobacteria bacterium]
MATRARKQDVKKNTRAGKVRITPVSLGNSVQKILKVSLENFQVSLLFQDGCKAAVSLQHLFLHPKGLAAEVLRGGIFEKCFVESGALAWPNGFELCPDSLRFWMEHP